MLRGDGRGFSKALRLSLNRWLLTPWIAAEPEKKQSQAGHWWKRLRNLSSALNAMNCGKIKSTFELSLTIAEIYCEKCRNVEKNSIEMKFFIFAKTGYFKLKYYLMYLIFLPLLPNKVIDPALTFPCLAPAQISMFRMLYISIWAVLLLAFRFFRSKGNFQLD